MHIPTALLTYLFTSFWQLGEPTSSTFELSWWIFGSLMQIPTALFVRFGFFDADTDSTFRWFLAVW